MIRELTACVSAQAQASTPRASLWMQFQKTLEPAQIASHRPRCCLHFYREDSAAGLDDEIHFMAGRGAPRTQFRARIASRGPCPQLVTDPRLRPGTPKPAFCEIRLLTVSRQMGSQARIRPEQAGAFGEPLAPVHGERRQLPDEERNFHERQVACRGAGGMPASWASCATFSSDALRRAAACMNRRNETRSSIADSSRRSRSMYVPMYPSNQRARVEAFSVRAATGNPPRNTASARGCRTRCFCAPSSRVRRSAADSAATAASRADPSGTLSSSDHVKGKISRYTGPALQVTPRPAARAPLSHV